MTATWTHVRRDTDIPSDFHRWCHLSSDMPSTLISRAYEGTKGPQMSGHANTMDGRSFSELALGKLAAGNVPIHEMRRMSERVRLIGAFLARTVPTAGSCGNGPHPRSPALVVVPVESNQPGSQQQVRCAQHLIATGSRGDRAQPGHGA